MSEKEPIKISLTAYVISLIIMVVIVVGLVFYIVQNRDNDTEKLVDTNTSMLESNVSEKTNVTNEQKESTDIVNVNEYFILYNGYEIKNETGIQNLSDMKVTEEAKTKYNTKYYNYEKGKYVGETKGVFGNETYEGVSVVENVKKIAISEKYNAIPRIYTTLDKLPEQLKDMADYSSVKINSIDLDGDGKTEYVVCYTVNYAKGEIGDGEPEASSGIILFDSNFKKVSDLVTLENGFWGNIKEEDKKVFLSLDDTDYIDTDNDGIMEIILKVPTYEGTKISIVKYNNGKIEGEKNLKASVLP